MKLQQSQREEPDVNLTPLIDVVLLLLVFFMVSTSFVREAELKIELPEATIAAVQTIDAELEIIVQADGRLFINGRELVNSDRRTLTSGIEKLVGDRRDIPFRIRADGRATHQDVVRVMDVASKMGFTSVSIITAEADDAASP